jgi:hypothetical protein
MTQQVAITVDVEFTIGGAFADPSRRAPIGPASVECTIDGEGAGLDFILDTLEAHGFKGVFFVEALNTSHFGDAPMGAIARRIHARGHDVQLHAHPCWMAFLDDGWRARVRDATPVDSFAALDDAAIERALAMGLEAFSGWGLPRPRAFRAGNLQADARLYRCLERCAIPMASNVGIGIWRPEDPALRLAGGRHRIGGTLEVPVSSYPDVRLPGHTRWKSFTIVGTGAWEARQWLRSAAGADVGPVVVLTHPTEFVHDESGDYTRLARNTIARRRLDSLCSFLARHADVFEVVTFSRCVDAWTASPDTANPQWHVSPWARALRVVENRVGYSHAA